MLARLRSLNIADRRDVLLFLVAGLVLFALTVVWALYLVESIPAWLSNQFFMLLLVLVFSLLVAVIPRLTWARNDTRPNARFFVRLGLAMQIMGLIITPVGLYFETNPVISVPIGFAAFLVVFFGVFVAGFSANAIAPQRV